MKSHQNEKEININQKLTIAFKLPDIALHLNEIETFFSPTQRDKMDSLVTML